MQGQSNNIPLSNIGKEQMHTLGKYLQKHGNNGFIIIVSPMLRAQQSLEIINSYLNTTNNNINILCIAHESVNRIIPQVLTPEIENNNIVVNNRQSNDELVVIENNIRI
jgi:broad specificity phosphatase PhoE